MTTGLNSMTGVIFEDLICPMTKRPNSEKCASLIISFHLFSVPEIHQGGYRTCHSTNNKYIYEIDT
jgi:hypothetical protein